MHVTNVRLTAGAAYFSTAQNSYLQLSKNNEVEDRIKKSISRTCVGQIQVKYEEESNHWKNTIELRRTYVQVIWTALE